MEHRDFESYIRQVARMTLEQGGTASKPETGEFLPPRDSWSFPKYPQRTIILPPEADLVKGIEEFVSENEAYLKETDCWLGTWINPRTGCYYLDIATSCDDLERACGIARETSLREGRKIVALYNSKRAQIHYLWDDVSE